MQTSSDVHPIQRLIVILTVACFAILTISGVVESVLAEETVYKGSEPGIVPPKPTKRVKAHYDEAARPEKIEGLVRIKMVISRDGKPRDITVLESLDPRLDSKAIEAANQWQWQPAALKGKPVACGVVLEFYFKP